jgi:hypothetical protein
VYNGTINCGELFVINKKYFERVLIDCLLKDLHNQQMQMIELAVEKSEMREAKEVIQYIMEKPNARKPNDRLV